MDKDTLNRMVFVFGSNEGGIHGAGAARYAYEFRGAIYGCGYGHTDSGGYNPGSFAIPTKDRTIRHTLPLAKIEEYVDGFILYAAARPDLKFQVTCIGCGLAGLKHEHVAPMFIMACHLKNVFFDELWREHLPPHAQFWGTF